MEGWNLGRFCLEVGGFADCLSRSFITRCVVASAELHERFTLAIDLKPALPKLRRER